MEVEVCQALLAEVVLVDSSAVLFVRYTWVPSTYACRVRREACVCILQLRVVKMESCVKLFVDTAVMSTALKALQSSVLAYRYRPPHTSAHVPTHAASRMLSTSR